MIVKILNESDVNKIAEKISKRNLNRVFEMMNKQETKINLLIKHIQDLEIIVSKLEHNLNDRR